MLPRMVKRAVELWKTDGPAWVAGAAASKVVELFYPVLPPVTYKALYMFLRQGYWPNIRTPRTLNEKIAHRQLFAPHPLSSLVADKWRVRQYVAERGLAQILNEVYFVTDDPEKIPFDNLPDRFVIKANHGSLMNLFVTDKQTLDRQRVIRLCRRWLRHKYGRATLNYETHYDGIPPMILVERYIDEGEHYVPTDYKFFCFHGSARLIEVDLARFVSHTRAIYDREWKDTGIRLVFPRGEVMPRPPRLAEMIQIAERLSGDFDFCRVDLYAPAPETILFGEITTNHGGGLERFVPREWDLRLGELW